MLAVGVLAIAFSGCSVKLGEIAPPSLVAVTEASIVGIWSTSCMENSADSYIKSFEAKEDGTITITTLKYVNSRTCDAVFLAGTLIESGVLTITGDSAAIAGVKNYEWQISAAVIIPNSAAIVTMLNDANACGSNAWALNQPGFLFGCAIDSGLDFTQVTFNTVHYGVFNMEVAVTPNYLQFESKCAVSGYYELCPTAGDRPATLDGTVFHRN